MAAGSAALGVALGSGEAAELGCGAGETLGPGAAWGSSLRSSIAGAAGAAESSLGASVKKNTAAPAMSTAMRPISAALVPCLDDGVTVTLFVVNLLVFSVRARRGGLA